jgi:putative phage-type endonuclease
LTRAEFLAERKSGVGGSDIAAVFSLPPYGCARRLWYDKRDVPADNEQDVTGPMIRGTKLEAIIAEEYAEKTGRTLKENGLARHEKYPELIVHIDREIDDPARPTTGVLECKTANRELFFRMKREGLLEGYILQIQHGMLVTGAAWGSFAVLWADGWQLLHWDVEADAALQQQIIDGCTNFWHLVQDGPAPDRLEIDDGRCRRCPYQHGCWGEEMERLVQFQGVGTVRDASLAGLVCEYQEASELVKQAEEYKAGVGEELKASMGDRVLVEVPIAGFRTPAKVHFKPNLEWNTAALEQARPDIAAKFKVKWDLTALGKAHPELEKQFKRVGTTRPLRIYGAK